MIELYPTMWSLSCHFAEGDTVDLSRDAYSPRDFNGHGSHTASTAGGNHDVPVDIPGVPQSLLGRASGMAPRARISAYKGLWYSGQKYPGGDYGTVVDLLAALEEAVSKYSTVKYIQVQHNWKLFV